MDNKGIADMMTGILSGHWLTGFRVTLSGCAQCCSIPEDACRFDNQNHTSKLFKEVRDRNWGLTVGIYRTTDNVLQVICKSVQHERMAEMFFQ